MGKGYQITGKKDSRELTRRSCGDVHHQSAESAGELEAEPGYHQHRRESALGSSDADSAGQQLAGRIDGPQVGCFRLPRHREELQEDDGLQGPVDSRRRP